MGTTGECWEGVAIDGTREASGDIAFAATQIKQGVQTVNSLNARVNSVCEAHGKL